MVNFWCGFSLGEAPWCFGPWDCVLSGSGYGHVGIYLCKKPNVHLRFVHFVMSIALQYKRKKSKEDLNLIISRLCRNFLASAGPGPKGGLWSPGFQLYLSALCLSFLICHVGVPPEGTRVWSG